MKLTKQEGKALVYEDIEGWEKVESEIYEASRWSIHYSGVFKHLETGDHYEMAWSVGATELQDERPFEYDEPELTKVKQVEVMITKWIYDN